MNHGAPIGVIAVTRAEPGAFASSHVQLLQTFADQAVIAIENTRLFNETQEALERQTATADILKVIASSPSDVQPVFDAIAASANRLVGGFSCTVVRFVEGTAYLEAFTPTTPDADEILQSSFPQSVAASAPYRLATAGEVMQIPDTEASTGGLPRIARARGFRSMLFAPLINKGETIGSIAVLGVIGTAAAYLLFFSIVAGAGAAYASLVTYLVPPVALAYGTIILGEHIGWPALAGLALILGGVALGTGTARLLRVRRAQLRSAA